MHSTNQRQNLKPNIDFIIIYSELQTLNSANYVFHADGQIMSKSPISPRAKLIVRRGVKVNCRSLKNENFLKIKKNYLFGNFSTQSPY